jgi:hypothetical protein
MKAGLQPVMQWRKKSAALLFETIFHYGSVTIMLTLSIFKQFP